ncbi:MAG: methionyl-tRNA formyltransferase [Saprospiraceae bacterium]|nr:methionyl-tRNA formyltransferase [Saprospiraceae bacterium]
MKIVFFGTPAFSIPCAEILNKNHQLLAVVTATDKPAGRGNKITESEMKLWAINNQIEVLQPNNLKSLKFYNKLNSLKADLFVVVAFRMLPESVWNMPPFGTLNIHASLLPDYRGAAPIQRSIMAGEKISGVSCFRLKHEIDTGDIIAQKKVEILDSDNGGSLYLKLSIEGAKLLIESIELVKDHNFKPRPQLINSAKIAPKIQSEDLLLNFNQTTKQVIDHIRALAPYPAARALYKNETYKIFSASNYNSVESNNNEDWYFDFEKQVLLIKCSDGWISVDTIQAPSRKKMQIKDFLNGLKNK